MLPTAQGHPCNNDTTTDHIVLTSLSASAVPFNVILTSTQSLPAGGQGRDPGSCMLSLLLSRGATSSSEGAYRLSLILPSLVTQIVKNLPAMRETQVPSLGWEDPLEKEMATHSSTRVWRISWRATVHGFTESDTTEQITLSH